LLEINRLQLVKRQEPFRPPDAFLEFAEKLPILLRIKRFLARRSYY
jgi:hypothetical protein